MTKGGERALRFETGNCWGRGGKDVGFERPKQNEFDCIRPKNVVKMPEAFDVPMTLDSLESPNFLPFGE